MHVNFRIHPTQCQIVSFGVDNLFICEIKNWVEWPKDQPTNCRDWCQVLSNTDTIRYSSNKNNQS